MLKQLGRVACVVCLVAGTLFGIPLVANLASASTPVSETCAIVPAHSPTTIQYGGSQAVAAGETFLISNTLQLGAGDLHQALLTLPDGTTTYASYMETVVPSGGATLDPASIAFTIDGVATPTTAGTAPDATNYVLQNETDASGNTTLRIYFPADLASASAGTPVKSVTIPAAGATYVLNAAAKLPATTAVATVANVAQCYTTTNNGTATTESQRVNVSAAVLQPEIVVTKDTTAKTPVFNAGGTSEYVIRVQVPNLDSATESIPLSVAYDVTVTDVLNASLIPVDANADPIADGAAVGANGQWNATTRTVTWTLPSITPGTVEELRLPVRISPAVAKGARIANKVDVAYRNLPSTDPESKSYTASATAPREIEIASGAPSISKSASVPEIGIGKPFQYTITVDIPANSSYENFTIVDTIPDGVQFVKADSATCTGDNCPADLPEMTSSTTAEGLTRIGWYPDTIPLDPAARTLTFVYTAQLTDGTVGPQPTFGQDFKNTVTGYYNVIDRLGDPVPTTTALPDYDGFVTDGETVRNNRPIIALTHASDRAPSWDYVEGELATYTVTVTNNGSIDAFDVDVRDALPAGMVLTPGSVTLDGAACPDATCVSAGNLTHTITGPLAPGSTATFTYTAAPNTTGTFTNTVQVPSFRDTNNTTYDDAVPATVSVKIDEPLVAVSKTALGSNFAVDQSQPIPFRFTVRNVSGTTVYAPEITDTPPAWLTYQSGSNSAEVTELSDNNWRLVAPTLAPGASVSFTANYVITGTTTVGTHTNNVSATWGDVGDRNDGDGNPYSATGSANFRLQQPTVSVTKTPDPDRNAAVNQDDDLAVAPARTGEWTIVVENTSAFPSYNITVTDPMPETLEVKPGTFTATWTGTARTFTETTAVDATAKIAGSSKVFSGTIDRLDPGQKLTLTVPFTQNGEVPSDGSVDLINTVTLSNPNWTGANDGWSDTGQYSLVPLEPGPRISKTATPATGPVGTEVTWTIDVKLAGSPTDFDIYDTVVVETLPDGFELTNEPAVRTAANSDADWTEGAWTGKCTAGDCTKVQYHGAYLGSAVQPDGTTQMQWYIGDYLDGDPANDATVQMTFTARLKNELSTGSGIGDGVNDPLINRARTLHNRDTRYTTGSPSGDKVTFPTGPVALNSTDTRSAQTQASFDVTGPTLDISKTAAVGGVQLADTQLANVSGAIGQAEPGDTINFTVTVTGGGTGSSHDIVFEDDLGGGRYTYTAGSYTVSAGTTCTEEAGPKLRCTNPGPLAAGETITLTYPVTAPGSADLTKSPVSGRNHDPDVINNTVRAIQYYPTATPAANDPALKAGQAVSRVGLFTPNVNSEIRLSAGPLCAAPVGASVEWLASANNNAGLTPNPTRAGVATAYGPTFTVTLPGTAELDLDNITASGPLGGDANYTTYTAFREPDNVASSGGKQVLTWNLGDMPRGNGGIAIRIPGEVKVASDMTASVKVAAKDKTDATARGANTGAAFTYEESSNSTGCTSSGGSGGGGDGDHSIAKTPDQSQQKTVLPGSRFDWTISVGHSRSAITTVTLTDRIPAGLDYLGSDSSAADYAPATASKALPDGKSLQDYYAGSITQPDGTEVVTWGPIPTIPTGNFTITIPTKAEASPPTTGAFVTNSITMNTDQGNRDDTGAVFIADPGAPVVTKAVSTEAPAMGDTFTTTIEVLIPAAYAAEDVHLYDQPNNGQHETNPDFVEVSPTWGDNRTDIEANMVFSKVVSAECTSGCTGAADTITPVFLQPDALKDPTTDLAGANAATSQAFGWFLGDIAADPEGQDRVLKFVVEMRAPTLAEMEAHRGQLWAPWGRTDAVAEFNAFKRLAYQNTAILRSGDNAAWDTDASGVPSVAGDQSKWAPISNGATFVAVDQVTQEISLPDVDYNKTCIGIGVDGKTEKFNISGRRGSWDLVITPIGTPNMRCTLTFTNLSAAPAYNVPVTDQFFTERYQGSKNFASFSAAMGFKGETAGADYVTALNVTEGASWLTSANGAAPMTFNIPQVAGNETVKIVYELRVDGWSKAPNSSGSASHVLGWRNSATRGAWTATPDANGGRLGAPWTQSQRFVFNRAGMAAAIASYPVAGTEEPWTTTGPFWGRNANRRVLYPQYLPQLGRAGDRRTHIVPLGLTFSNCGNWELHRTGCGGLRNDLSKVEVWDDKYIVPPNGTSSMLIALTPRAMEAYRKFEITAELPYGFEYVPGSARLVEADGFNHYRGNGEGTAANRFFDLNPAVQTSLTAGTATACNAAEYHRGGPKVSWTFDQSNEVLRQVWDHRWYNTDRYPKHFGQQDVAILMYDMKRTDVTNTCDPDITSADPWVVETNVNVKADYGTGQDNFNYSTLTPISAPASIEKTPDDGFFADNATTPFIIEAVNAGLTDLTDVAITDTLTLTASPAGVPTAIPYVCGSATATLTAKDGTESAATLTETQCDKNGVASANIAWTLASFPAGSKVRIEFPMAVPDEEPNDIKYSNSVSMDLSAAYGSILIDTGSADVANPSAPPTPTKTATNANPTVNDTFDFVVGTTMGAGEVFADMVYTDTVPDGYTFGDYGNINCAGTGCGVWHPSNIKTLPPVVNADGTTTIGWWFGSVPGARTDRTYNMAYSVTVDDTLADGTKIAQDTTLTNTVNGYSNDESKNATAPANAGGVAGLTWDFTSTADQTTAIQEPKITIEKAAVIDSGNAKADATDKVTYTVTVRNDGLVGAYDLRITDTPGPELEKIVMDPVTAPSVIVDGWTALAPAMQWYVPSLAPAATVTFTYTAEILDAYAPSVTADNEVRASDYRARPGTNPAPGDRIYKDLPPVSASVPLVGPGLNLNKYAGDSCADETQAGTIDKPFTWCVQLTNVGTAKTTAVKLVDTLPFGWKYDKDSAKIDGTAKEPTVSSDAEGLFSTLTWDIGDMDAAASIELKFTATPSVSSQLDVQNTVRAVGNDAAGNAVPITIPGYRAFDTASATLRTHRLSIAKAPVEQLRPLAGVGGTVNWTLTVANPGDNPVTNVVVTDTLPAGHSYTAGAATSAATGFSETSVTAGPPTEIVFGFTEIAAGATAEITVPVTVAATVTEGTDYLNLVSVKAEEVADSARNQALIRYFAPVTLSGSVFNDDDLNGQTSGTDGIAASVVGLVDAAGNTVYHDPVSGVFTTDAAAGFPAFTATTAADGTYTFDPFPAGDYQLQFTPPAGLSATFTDRGDDATDSDIARATNRTPTLTFTPGQTVGGVNAGFTDKTPGRVGGTIFDDADNSATKGGLESGIAGINVELISAGPDGVFGTADDVVAAATTTDADGNYAFEDLSSGDYQVRINPTAGTVPTYSDIGGDDTADSDIDRTTNRSATITVSDGSDDTVDAGIVQGANSIGNLVFGDTNGDGLQSGTETGVDAVTVELLAGANVVDTATTDTAGAYTFSNVPDGNWIVRFTAPAGQTFTFVDQGADDALDSDPARASGEVSVDLDSAHASATPVVLDTVDAGLVVAGNAISGRSFDDTDADGVRTAADSARGGQEVRLIGPGPDGVFGGADDVVLATTTTAADGTYSFDDVPDGQFAIQMPPPAGAVPAFRDSGADDTVDSDLDVTGTSAPSTIDSVANGGPQTETVDGGFAQGGNEVSGRLWTDTDGDGTLDATETGIAGQTVELKRPDGTVVATTTTDADGNYSFDNLPDGQYQVQYPSVADTVPAFTLPGGSAADRTTLLGPVIDLDSTNTDADPVSSTANNAGYVPTTNPGNISATVWDDADLDGIRDATEGGKAGVVVNLYDSDGNKVATTTTDASGAYAFNSIPPGDYTMEYETPADGSRPTFQNQGGDEAVDSDVNRTNGRTGVFTVSPGETETDTTAGFTSATAGTVTGSAFTDGDANGSSGDAADSPASGVEVKLMGPGPDGVFGGADDEVVATATTAADGSYSFGDIPSGDYQLEFTPPAGSAATYPDLSGGDDTTDSDINRSTNRTPTFTVTAGSTTENIDAGFAPGRNTIGDRVFNDLDGSGTQNTGDTNADGIVVSLRSGTVVVDTATTDTAGAYQFTDVPDGTWTVTFTPPAGRTFTWQTVGGDPAVDSDPDRTTGEVTVDLDSAGTSAAPVNEDGIDAGLVLAGNTLNGSSFTDANGDGVRGGGDSALAGQTVNLYGPGPDGVFGGADDVIVATATTDAAGSYSFGDVPDGQYVVEMPPPAGSIATFTDQGGDDTVDSDIGADGRTRPVIFDSVTNGGAQTSTVDGGFTTGGHTIDGTIWSDDDGDGRLDSGAGGEGGLAGQTVELKRPDGTVVATTTTDADGTYSFTNLPDGEYQVQFPTAVADHVPTFTAPGDSAADRNSGLTATVTLNSATEVGTTTLNAGFAPEPDPATIASTVWTDTDLDGRKDATETGMAGVEVQLLGTDGSILATTTTDANGDFNFGNLPSGDYSLGFVTPPDTSPTWPNIGGDETLDSDTDRTTGVTPAFTVAAGSTVSDQTTGVFPAPANSSIGDLVWDDRNGNGVQDDGEPGIAGVEVILSVGAASAQPAEGFWARTLAGAEVDVQTTDADGRYTFANIPPGTYQLRIGTDTLPNGYGFSEAGQGGDEALDSDFSSASTATGDIVVVAATDNLNVDAALSIATISVLKEVWDPAIDAWIDSPVAPGPIYEFGATGLWRLTVRNGAIPVTAVAVTDTFEPSCDRTFDSMAAHEEQTWECQTPDMPFGEFENIATVTATRAGQNVTATDNAWIDPPSSPPLQLKLTKELIGETTVTPGAELSWRLTATNTGEHATVGATVVSDTLPSSLSFVRAEGTGWVCSNDSARIDCRYDLPIKVGDSVAVTVVTRVANTVADNSRIENDATLQTFDVQGGVAGESDDRSTNEATASAVVDVPQTATEGAGTPPVLAFTGITTGILLLAGVFLIGSGSGLQSITRRKR